MTTPRYARAPSEELIQLLLDGLLTPLLDTWTASGLRLDFQLRENDEVMLYCGRSRIVVAQLRGSSVRITADKAYKRQACAQALMRAWHIDESGFGAALSTFVQHVEVGEQYTEMEGAVQADWMLKTEPWTSFDREAVIGGGLQPIQRVDEATDAIRTFAIHWAKVGDPKSANELDALAVDPEGRLTLVEHKWGGTRKQADFYYSPLQALRYAWEWSMVMGDIFPGIEKLISAKQRLGLLPADLPRPRSGLRVAVAWGDHQPSPEVLRRIRAVRDELHPFLPPGVDTIELWATEGGRPCQI